MTPKTIPGRCFSSVHCSCVVFKASLEIFSNSRSMKEQYAPQGTCISIREKKFLSPLYVPVTIPVVGSSPPLGVGRK